MSRFLFVYSPRIVLRVSYGVLVGTLAASSQIGTFKPLLILLAGALSLPFGIFSTIGYYFLTGLFNGIAGGFPYSSHGSGGGFCDPSGHCEYSSTQTGFGAHGLLFTFSIFVLYTTFGIFNFRVIRSLYSRIHPRKPN